MTPQQKKADELVERFKEYSPAPYLDGFGLDFDDQLLNAIQCAIICVEEIIKLGLLSMAPIKHEAIKEVYGEYWQSVLNELKSRV